MFNGEATQKILGGKLVRIKIAFDEKIQKLQITGDFFLHPEECVHDIENALIGVDINFQPEALVNQITGILKSQNAEIIGMDSETVVRTMKMAIENGKMATNTS